MGQFIQPTSLDPALAALAARRCAVLAGGTDFYPARLGGPVDEDVLDLGGIPELRGVQVDSSGIRIGAATTWAEIRETPRLPAWFRGLRLAAREVGGEQIQNTGTVAGNLCNASPAADGVPALLALGASVELASVRGRRALPLAAFVTGPRRTALGADELVSAIHVPRHAEGTRSSFLKLGARRYLVISIAMVSAVIEPDAAGRVARAGVAIGACSAVAVRLPALEARLVGRALDASLADAVRSDDLAPIQPIDDVRATAAYRREAAFELVRRALVDAVTAEHGA